MQADLTKTLIQRQSKVDQTKLILGRRAAIKVHQKQSKDKYVTFQINEIMSRLEWRLTHRERITEFRLTWRRGNEVLDGGLLMEC